jgi:hypothetical protein
MRKKLSLISLLFFSLSAAAQLQVAKIIGKSSKDFQTGYGGFLKISYPVSAAADVTLELGANVFNLKADPASGWIIVPLKAGFRYTFNKTGSGFYVEPQAGYNLIGYAPSDNENSFTGLVLAGGTGYLFQPAGKINLDIGLYYESAFHKGGSANYLSLRLTHNFSLRRRESE